MRKRVSHLLLVFLTIVPLLPIGASAIGGYFIIKGENTYHSVFCDQLTGHNIEDLQFYDTLEKVERTGRKPCEECCESGFDYEPDNATHILSKDPKLQNAMDLERLYGVFYGYDYGNEEGYNSGYNYGYDEGYDDGYSVGQEDGWEEGNQEGYNDAFESQQERLDTAYFYAILLMTVCMVESGTLYTIYRNRKRETDKRNAANKALEEKKVSVEKQIALDQKNAAEWKRKVLSEIADEEKASHEEINLQREKLENDTKIFKKLVMETKQSHPMLAAEIADAQHYLDMGVYGDLINKQRPALRAADELKKIASEKRTLVRENRSLQYQLDFYENLFPWLEEFKEVPSDEAIAYATGSYGTEYDAVRKWLSPEEYAKLENVEKYQIALDRWKNRKKEDWDVGIEYERYIGYRLECDGYKVTYLGATLGLKDMGRDLLAVKDGDTLVIQCKRWAKEKTIHEKHIFQLYGSTAVLSIENPGVKYKGVFVTTATLSDTAKKCAEYCGISVVEGCPMNDYPLIKCNASKTGERIYHLPFDQQYDKVVISKNKQSCYAWTTKEAESKGFRRAYRWHPNNS